MPKKLCTTGCSIAYSPSTAKPISSSLLGQDICQDLFQCSSLQSCSCPCIPATQLQALILLQLSLSMLGKSKSALLFELQCCGLSPWMPLLIQEGAVALPGLGTSPPGGLLGPSQQGPACTGGRGSCRAPAAWLGWQLAVFPFPFAPTAAPCSSPHITPVPVSSDTVPTLCPAPCPGAAESSPPEEQDWASKGCSLYVSSKTLWNLCLQVLLKGMLKLLWPDMPKNPS